jgi:hypothetical protein
MFAHDSSQDFFPFPQLIKSSFVGKCGLCTWFNSLKTYPCFNKHCSITSFVVAIVVDLCIQSVFFYLSINIEITKSSLVSKVGQWMDS